MSEIVDPPKSVTPTQIGCAFEWAEPKFSIALNEEENLCCQYVQQKTKHNFAYPNLAFSYFQNSNPMLHACNRKHPGVRPLKFVIPMLLIFLTFSFGMQRLVKVKAIVDTTMGQQDLKMVADSSLISSQAAYEKSSPWYRVITMISRGDFFLDSLLYLSSTPVTDLLCKRSQWNYSSACNKRQHAQRNRVNSKELVLFQVNSMVFANRFCA